MGQRRQQRAAAWAFVLVAAMAVGRAAAQDPSLPSVMELAPADAKLMVVIPSLARISEKLSVLNDELRLDIPGLADSLGELKRSIGISKGLQDSGPLLIAFTEMPTTGAAGQTPFVLFIPVADYGAFVGNYAADPKEEVVRLVLPTGQAAFSRHVDSFAVISRDQELVQRYQRSDDTDRFKAGLGRLGAMTVADSDISIVTDVAAMSGPLRSLVRQALQAARAQITEAEDSQFSGLVLSMYGSAVEAILRDSSMAAMGIKVDKAGIGTTLGVQFKRDSAMAKQFQQSGGASQLIDQLPSREYLWANSFSFGGMGLKQVVQDTLRTLGTQLGWLGELTQPALPLLDQAEGMAQILYAPQGAIGLGTSLTSGITLIRAKDPARFVQAFQNYVKALNGKTVRLPPMAPNAPAGEMAIVANYTPNALAAEEGQIDQYQIQYNLPPQVLAQMGQAGGLLMMLGGTTQSGYIVARDQYVLMTTTPDPQMIKQAMASMKEGKGLGQNPGITQMRPFLTPDPAAEGYLNVGAIARTVNTVMGMLSGSPAELLTVPVDLPPVAFSASIADSGLAKRVFVPMPVVQFARDTYDRLSAAFQPARPPGQERPDQPRRPDQNIPPEFGPEGFPPGGPPPR